LGRAATVWLSLAGAAAVLLLFILARAPAPGPGAIPSADTIVGPIARDAAGQASSRLDRLYADRLARYRQDSRREGAAL
jgi:hypothetical protein